MDSIIIPTEKLLHGIKSPTMFIVFVPESFELAIRLGIRLSGWYLFGTNFYEMKWGRGNITIHADRTLGKVGRQDKEVNT